MLLDDLAVLVLSHVDLSRHLEALVVKCRFPKVLLFFGIGGSSVGAPAEVLDVGMGSSLRAFGCCFIGIASAASPRRPRAGDVSISKESVDTGLLIFLCMTTEGTFASGCSSGLRLMQQQSRLTPCQQPVLFVRRDSSGPSSKGL